MRIRHVNLTEGTIWKQLLRFALPLFVLNMMQQLYSATDLIVVGNFSGVDAMAGVGATASIISLLTGLAGGLATGVSVVTVQMHSSEDYDGLYKVVHAGYALALVSGLFFTATGLFLSPVLLRVMKTPADIMPYAVTYLRLYSLGLLPVTLYNIGAGILRGVGDTRHPFIFLSLGVLLNVGLDFLFIGVLGWGVAGAAWAFVIAQLLTALMVTFSLAASMTPFRLFLRDIAFHPPVLIRSLRVGIPAGIQTFIVSLSNIFVQSFINRFGKHAMAGFSAASRTDSFVFVLISGLALATMTFTGANLGAGKMDRVRRGFHHSLILMIVLVGFLSGLLTLLRRPIAAAFNPDPRVMAHTTRIIVFFLAFYWVFSLTEVMGAVLRGANRPFFPLVANLVCMAGVRLVWMYAVLPVWKSFDAVIVAYPVSWTVLLIAYTAYCCFKKSSLFDQAVKDRRGSRRGRAPAG